MVWGYWKDIGYWKGFLERQFFTWLERQFWIFFTIVLERYWILERQFFTWFGVTNLQHEPSQKSLFEV